MKTTSSPMKMEQRATYASAAPTSSPSPTANQKNQLDIRHIQDGQIMVNLTSKDPCQDKKAWTLRTSRLS